MSGLLDRRLLVVTGKGGVGKSTVAAALGAELAARGRRTLLCEVNADERLAPLLGHRPVGAEVRQVEPRLSLVDVRPTESMREYVLMKIPVERLYRAVFENKMVRYFLRFIPSLAETVMLGKILWHVRQPAGAPGGFDAVVVDAPSTGHALSLLGVPQTLLSTLPAGPMTSEARWMRELLVDPAVTGILLVSLPEELPVNETLELDEALRRGLGLPVEAVVLNQSVRTRFGPETRQALTDRPGLLELVQSHEEDAARTADAATRLAALEHPIARLPRLVVPELGRAEVDELGHALAGGLERSR
jgi:anion-transporting  ArsA/GET3 family ATPase